MRRTIAVILAISNVLNGAVMLLAGPFWYASVPGASETGPSIRILSRILARLLLLREDAVAVTDGGGRKPAALNPIYGAEKIARLFISLAGKNADRDIRIEPAMVNGSLIVLLDMDGELDHTLSMSIDGEQIAAVYVVRNPDKLRHAPRPVAR